MPADPTRAAAAKSNQPFAASQFSSSPRTPKREAIQSMKSERFAALHSEFETLSNRLQQARDLSERQVILTEVRRFTKKVNAILERSQAKLQRKLGRLRDHSRA